MKVTISDVPIDLEFMSLLDYKCETRCRAEILKLSKDRLHAVMLIIINLFVQVDEITLINFPNCLLIEEIMHVCLAPNLILGTFISFFV